MYSPYDHEKYPVRKYPRIKGYDYTSSNYYFVTVCTRDKACIFGSAGLLNDYGNIAKKGLCEVESHFSGVKVDKMVVMPNHIHAIIVLDGNSVTLSNVVGSFKSFVSKEIHKSRPDVVVWQKSFHDHIIRNEGSYQKIWSYIDSNPQNWKKDCFFTE